MRFRGTLWLLATLVVLPSAACDDDPFQIDWDVAPDTVLLYSLARPELGLPSAYNFNRRTFVEIENPGATGNWDLALDTQDGEFVFLTPGAMGIQSRARITTLTGMTFEEVREAPADTAAYVGDRPVPVQLGPIYVIQTDQSGSSFGTQCVFYAKLEALEADVTLGTLRVVYDSNPVCNSRDLVPPGD
ncbi:MAG: hypothetical protein P8188_19300 [Gemmatimonadota bacterium]|jgi:hypothetical protein